MTNRLGYNYLNVPDVTEEMRHARAARLGGGLFFQNQIDFAREFKRNLPHANVVIRNWPDGAVPKSVDDWLSKNRHLSEGGLIVQTVNEVGFTTANLAFHETLLERIKRDKIDIRVGILAQSVGTPGADEWPRAGKIIRLADELRDKVHIILHEYWGGVVTSGFHGGNPTMIQPETWPLDTSKITLWHVGRYRFLKATCRIIGVPLPRIIIGEFGADFTGDIGLWLASLQSTKGKYDIVDGWRDLTDQWRTWWKDWDGATAYMKQAAYADKHIYTDPEIESILLYCRWNDGSWGTYQVNPELDKLMEAYNSPPIDTPPVEPPTPPSPPDAIVPSDLGNVIATRIIGDNWFMRSEPSANAAQIGKLLEGEEIKLYPATAIPADGQSYKVVERIIAVAGEARIAWSAYPTPTNAPPVSSDEKLNTIARLIVIRAKIHAMASLMEDVVRDIHQMELDIAASEAAKAAEIAAAA